MKTVRTVFRVESKRAQDGFKRWWHRPGKDEFRGSSERIAQRAKARARSILKRDRDVIETRVVMIVTTNDVFAEYWK